MNDHLLPERIAAIIGKQHFTFDDLADIVRYLRSPDGCPWDRAQTHESIAMNSVEEVYELNDAVSKRDPAKIVEEAGDVILQSLLHAAMGEEEGAFTLQDVIDGECRKLIGRHTHIFAGDVAAGEADALKFWERNKYEEKQLLSAGERVADVPKSFPALLRAEKLQKRAAEFNVGAKDKARARAELIASAEDLGEDPDAASVGRLLFAAVALARACGIKAESALAAACDGFTEKFLAAERTLGGEGRTFSDLGEGEYETYFDEVKEH